MAINKEAILDQLRLVNDPELHRSLVDLGMVREISISGNDIDITIELTTPACPLKGTIQADVESAVRQMSSEIGRVNVKFTAKVRSRVGEGGGGHELALPEVSHIIAVGAGKGGVGKSTVAVHLAVGLAREGASVGLLDGDIYGPSLPTMLGLAQLQPELDGHMVVPFAIYGIKAMSLGALVEDDKPLIWRGPMAHKAFHQLVSQTQWGKLDYLVIDLPPGTGDVPLTMCQTLSLTGAVIVCTPQKVAQDDARRAVRMFQTLDVPIIGVVENMSSFIGDDGKEYDIFGKGGAEMMATDMGLPFLGAIPINMSMRENCDAGDPAANYLAGGRITESLESMTRTVAGKISILAVTGKYQQATIKVTD